MHFFGYLCTRGIKGYKVIRGIIHVVFFSTFLFRVGKNPDVLTFSPSQRRSVQRQDNDSMTGDAKAGWLGVYFGR